MPSWAKRGRKPPPLGSKEAREGEPDQPSSGDREYPGREPPRALSRRGPRARSGPRKAERKRRAGGRRGRKPGPPRRTSREGAAREGRKACKKLERLRQAGGRAQLPQRRARPERPARSRTTKPSAGARPLTVDRRAREVDPGRDREGRGAARPQGRQAARGGRGIGPEGDPRGAVLVRVGGAKVVWLLIWAGCRRSGRSGSGRPSRRGALLWLERIAAVRARRPPATALRVAERVVTPERAVAFVVIAAAIILAASQFVDYRGVEIGAPAYAGVESVAPAPQTDVETTGLGTATRWSRSRW